MRFDQVAQDFASQVLKSSRDNPFQCLTVLFILYICSEPLFVLHPWSPVLPPGSTFKNLASSSWWPPCRHGQDAVASSWSCLFSRPKEPSSPSTLWRAITPVPASPPHLICYGPSLNSCQFTNAFRFWVSQYWMQYCSCGLMTVGYRGIITSLQLLALLLHQQSRTLLLFAARAYHWLIFSYLPTRTSKSFSAELHPSCAVITHIRCRILHFFPLLNFLKFLLALLSNLSRSLWMAALPLSAMTGPQFDEKAHANGTLEWLSNWFFSVQFS